MDINVSGAADLHRFAKALTAAGERGLRRELDKSSRQAAQEFVAEVEGSLGQYLPSSNGYERDFRTGFQTRTELRVVSHRRISVVFWSIGKLSRNRRDIRRLNAGTLRAPVHGRTRRLRSGVHVKDTSRIKGDQYVNPWVGHRIRPALVDEPFERAGPAAIRKLDEGVQRVAAKIEKEG